MSGPAFQLPACDSDTLPSLLLSLIEGCPDSEFIEINHAGQRASSTTAELYPRALKILSKLRERTSAGQSDIVLCFESVLDFIPAAWACVFGEYSCLPWHVPKALSEGEIASRLQVFGRRLNRPVLVTTDRISSRIASFAPSPFRGVLSIDRDPEEQSQTASRGKASMPAAETDGGGAFLMLTSGTTGGPKIAVVAHRCLLSRFLSRQEGLSASVRLVCFPFDRVTGLWVIFPSPAGTIFLQPDRLAARPLDLLKIVEELRVERSPMSSSIAARILEALQDTPQRYDLSSLKEVTFGAEMIVPSIVSKLGMAFRQLGADTLRASFGYGMTETGLICQTPNMALDQTADQLNLGASLVSVGGCTAGFSLRIVSDEGNATPPGRAGNIEVWSREKLFSGYRNDPGLT